MVLIRAPHDTRQTVRFAPHHPASVEGIFLVIDYPPQLIHGRLERARTAPGLVITGPRIRNKLASIVIFIRNYFARDRNRFIKYSGCVRLSHCVSREIYMHPVSIGRPNGFRRVFGRPQRATDTHRSIPSIMHGVELDPLAGSNPIPGYDNIYFHVQPHN